MYHQPKRNWFPEDQSRSWLAWVFSMLRARPHPRNKIRHARTHKHKTINTPSGSIERKILSSIFYKKDTIEKQNEVPLVRATKENKGVISIATRLKTIVCFSNIVAMESKYNGSNSSKLCIFSTISFSGKFVNTIVLSACSAGAGWAGQPPLMDTVHINQPAILLSHINEPVTIRTS